MRVILEYAPNMFKHKVAQRVVDKVQTLVRLQVGEQINSSIWLRVGVMALVSEWDIIKGLGVCEK